ncbi:MAG: AzlD domain-containing protein [Pseudomonadota bacterium]
MTDVLFGYGALIIAGVVMTYMWRFAGVLAAQRLSPDSEALRWVRAVATALIAGIVAQLVVSPPGALGEMPELARYVAFVTGCMAFFILGRSVPLGVGAAIAALIGLSLVLPG